MYHFSTIFKKEEKEKKRKPRQQEKIEHKYIEEMNIGY
jgi:hypothetical protein